MKLFLLFLLTATVQGRATYVHDRPAHPHDIKGPLARPQLGRAASVHQKKSITKHEIPQPVDIPEVNKGLGLVEGDLQESSHARSTIYDEELFWPKQIPIVYTEDITPLKRAVIDIAREEYELRTCLSLPERTDEENYITFRSLSGCWSYIGMNGGAQNISIGDGCERIGTIEHEVMHALGVFHEQSRTDRDDYVEIVYDKINPGSVSNFNKYGYDEIDDRRVTYDYTSIMHYSKTGFTIDGNITIRTRDPKFQDTIGQRGSFSEGDVTKIARMYDCSEPIRKTFVGNFEDEAESGYTSYMTNSEVDWIQHKVGLSSVTGPTTQYLPNFDSTLGMDTFGSYMYLDTTKGFPGLSGVFKSMSYTSTVARQCLEFSYFLNLGSSSKAALTVYIASIDEVTGEVTNYGLPLQTFDESTGNSAEWNVHKMTVSAPSIFRILFYGKTDYRTTDVIAIDDVSITDKECDTSYFMIENYADQMNNLGIDEPIESPLMYTGQRGYAYKVLVYPQGTQTAIDNDREEYMGMYIQLCPGDYDNELEWPFDNQYIRLSITDQGPNPNTRINILANFITSKDSTLNASYERPVTVCNDQVGYSAFTQREKLNTRMYLKHDVMYVSVMIRDMRPFVGDYGASLPNPSTRNYVEPKVQAYDTEKNSAQYRARREADLDADTGDIHDMPVELSTMQPSFDNMIPISSAVFIILGTSLGVFLIMALTIACVASSYKKKLEYRLRLQAGVNPMLVDSLKYSNLRGKI